MADGKVIIDTELNDTGLRTGLAGLAGTISSGIGVAVKAASAALVGLGTYAVKVGSDFEAGMSKVAAISGATSEELTALTNKAEEMAASTKFNLSETADAFTYMAMAGWDTADMLEGIEGIMSLAAASGEDLATTSDIVTYAMTALGMQTNEAGHFADVLAAASSSANTNVSMMGESFKYAAALAGTLGYSAEDVALALSAMADSGIKSSQAGVYMRGMLTRLSSNTNGARDAIEELGVAFFNQDGSARSLTVVMDELRAATANMTAEEKANFANKVAGMSAQAGFLAILNEEPDKWDRISEAINNCTDAETGYSAAAEMAETMMDNLQGDMTKLSSATNVFANSLYKAMSAAEDGKGPFRDLTQYATELVNELNNAVSENGLAGFASAIGSVLSKAISKVLEYVPQFAKGAVDLVQSFIDGLVQSSGAIANAAAQIGTILLNGFLNITASLVELGAQLLVNFANAITKSAPVIFNAITNFGLQIVDIIVEWAPQLVTAAIQLVQAIADGVIDNFWIILDAVLNALPTLVDALASSLSMWMECVTNIVTGIANELPNIISIIVQVLPTLIDSIVNALTQLIPQMIQCGVTIFTALIKNLPDIISTIVQALPAIITGIVSGLLGMVNMIVDCGIQLLTALVQALPDIIYAIVAVLPQIIAAIVSSLVGMIPQIITCGIRLLTSLVSALPQIIVAIVAVIPEIIISITTAFLDNIPLIIQCGIDLLTQLIAALPDIISAIVMAMPTIVVSIVEAFIQNIGKIAECGIKLLTSLITNLPQIITTIVGAIPKIIQGIVQAILGAKSQIVDAGYNLLSGMAEGIGNAIGNVVARAREAASRVASSVKGFFGIASPSKMFRDVIGKNLMLGLAEGIEEETAEAVAAAEDAADKISKVDFNGLAANMAETVDASRNATATAASSGGVYGLGGSDISSTDSGDTVNGVNGVETHIYLDKKEVARTLTPAIAKQLEWDGK